jgi:subtilisin family serine protease
MAGLIAGHGHGKNGTQGVLGIAPRASVLSVQTVHSDFGGDPAHLGDGIDWAVAHGAKVVCVAAVTSEEPAVKTAIEAAIKADVVVVAGVGNTPTNTTVGFPAKLPGVLAVGGVDRNGNHASISAVGPEMAISAPAVDITSTGVFEDYRLSNGTSDATAIVAGVAALVRAKYPTLSEAEVIHRLTATATDRGAPGRDPQYGYGIVNPVAALTADVPPIASATPGPTAAGGSGTRGRSLPIALIAIPVGVAGVLIIGGLISIALGRRRRNSPAAARRH